MFSGWRKLENGAESEVNRACSSFVMACEIVNLRVLQRMNNLHNLMINICRTLFSEKIGQQIVNAWDKNVHVTYGVSIKVALPMYKLALVS